MGSEELSAGSLLVNVKSVSHIVLMHLIPLSEFFLSSHFLLHFSVTNFFYL